jgi:hypothetical protein
MRGAAFGVVGYRKLRPMRLGLARAFGAPGVRGAAV